MPTPLAIGRWHVEADAESTRALYAKRPVGSGCDCEDCQRFEQMSPEAYPQDARSLASALGIDVTKPAELCHFGEDPPGVHIVSAWFHAVGRILDGRVAWKIVAPDSKVADFDKLPSGTELALSEDVALVHPDFKGFPLVQFELLLRVPWPSSN